MKIIVINFSGNVGKTTVASQLLAPRIKNSKFISVEREYRKNNLGELLEKALIYESIVVDVGSSITESFLETMIQYDGCHEDYDLFLIPAVPYIKQQRDTITTIEALSAIGIPAEKIKPLFNMLDPEDKLESSFRALFEYHESEKKCTVNPLLRLQKNKCLDEIWEDGKKSVKDILKELPELERIVKAFDKSHTLSKRGKLKAGFSEEARHWLARKITIARSASKVTEELDGLFDVLMNVQSPRSP